MHGDRLVRGGGDPVLLHVGEGVLAFLFHVPVVVEVGVIFVAVCCGGVFFACGLV